METQKDTTLRTDKPQEQSQPSIQKFTRYFAGFCVLFIFSAVSFCPVTQAALASLLPPMNTGFTVSSEWIAHLAFFGLLVIGLKMRTKYQD